LIRIFSVCACAAAATTARLAVKPPSPATGSVQFVFSSDAHYAITRPAFRGATDLNARDVNRALEASINALSMATFPPDGGIASGPPVGSVGFFVEGVDVSNREEIADGMAIDTCGTRIPTVRR
jgi:hypothetical protein